MYCKICGRFFLQERRFNEIFRQKIVYFCQECCLNYQISLNEVLFPLSKGRKLMVISIYNCLIPKPIIPYFATEYSRIYELLAQNQLVLLEDKFNYDMLATLEKISILLESNLILLVLNLDNV